MYALAGVVYLRHSGYPRSRFPAGIARGAHGPQGLLDAIGT